MSKFSDLASCRKQFDCQPKADLIKLFYTNNKTLSLPQLKFVLDQQESPLAHLNDLLVKMTERQPILKDLLKVTLLGQSHSGPYQLVDQ